MAQLVKTMAGLAIASVKTVNGLAIASVKTVAGLDNTSGGGAPAGNSFTIVGYTGLGNSTSVVAGVDGNIGDIWVIWFKWEDTGTITSIQGDISGTATLRGTQVNHANGDMHSRFATLVCAHASNDETITVTGSGSLTFRDWAVWRVRATGTIDYSIGNQATGTSTSVNSGTFTTITQNGLVLVGCGVYGSTTASAQQVGGNAASNTRAITGSSSVGWDYIHSAQISSGAATATLSPSIEWVTNALALSAQ